MSRWLKQRIFLAKQIDGVYGMDVWGKEGIGQEGGRKENDISAKLV